MALPVEVAHEIVELGGQAGDLGYGEIASARRDPDYKLTGEGDAAVCKHTLRNVIPAEAGIPGWGCGGLIARPHPTWIPDSAGMTRWGVARFRNYQKSLNKTLFSYQWRFVRFYSAA